MFQQEQSHDVTASSQQETGEDLQNLLKREEIVDLKQYIHTEANAAAEARLSELMKALDENGDGQVSVTEFTEHATEENLNKLVTNGVITEGEKSIITQDRRYHQEVGSKGDSLNNPKTDEVVDAHKSPSNEPAPQEKASMEDILAAMGVATGPHNDTQQTDTTTKQELPLEDLDRLHLDSQQEHGPETLTRQADLEALRAIRDEMSHNPEKHLEVVAPPGRVEVIEDRFLAAEPDQAPAEEIKVNPERLSDALSHSLERLETISPVINADLENNAPLPHERVGQDVDSDTPLQLSEESKSSEPVSARQEDTEDPLDNEPTNINNEVDIEGLIRHALDPNKDHATSLEDQRPPSSTRVELVPALQKEGSAVDLPDQENSQENSMQRQNPRFKGRPGDLIFYA